MKAEGWEKRLAAEIEAARDLPFAWGAHDCASWCYRVACALRKEPAEAAWLGRYKSERGAALAIKREGHATLAGAVSAHLGEPLPSPLFAQRGDVVMSRGALGICAGEKAAFVGPDGLEWRRLRDCDIGWRV